MIGSANAIATLTFDETVIIGVNNRHERTVRHHRTGILSTKREEGLGTLLLGRLLEILADPDAI